MTVFSVDYSPSLKLDVYPNSLLAFLSMPFLFCYHHVVSNSPLLDRSPRLACLRIRSDTGPYRLWLIYLRPYVW